MTRLKVVKVTIQYFDKGSQLSNTSQNSVNVRTWEGRLPVQKQSCITPCEEDRELLVQMSDSLTPILPSLPCLGRGQLLHLSNSLLVPAPQGLPWHRDKDHPLPPAGLTSLSHLPVVGSVQGSASLGGCLSDQLGLEGVDDSHVQSCVPPPCPVWDHDISRSCLCVWQQRSVLPGGSQAGCLGDSIESISQTVMPGYSLSLVTTRDGVVTQHITVVVAGWALTSLREHWNPKPVLDRYHKLTSSHVEAKCRGGQHV